MRLAILADIHGNALALDAVCADLAQRRIDQVVNLGDCVSGPLWPRETAERLMRLGWPTVRGNHDRWVTDLPLDKQSSWDAFARRELDAYQLDWLGALPPRLDLGSGILAFHGRPDDDNAYLLEEVADGRLMRSSSETVATRISGVADAIVLCAHSHLQNALCLPDGRWVINPGSVGCPAYTDPTPPAHVSEAGGPQARYAVLQLAHDEVSLELLAIPYDHREAARRAEANGQPAWAYALATGYARR
jgi:predicted phosphodiesterase